MHLGQKYSIKNNLNMLVLEGTNFGKDFQNKQE
jgi:hypothetical protein